MIESLVDPKPVACGLLEFQQPSISDAFDQLVSRGCRHIEVAPLLLFAAGHAKSDIPDIIAQCVQRHPGVTTSQSRPLSRHSAIVELAASRIATELSECDLDHTSLVLVGRGSYDPCAKSDMRVLSEVVARRLDLKHWETAFYAMAEPRLPDVLDQVAASPTIRRVVVYPHLLLQGRLYDAIDRQTNEAKERHPSTDFQLCGYLGPVDGVAHAVVDRAEESSRSSPGSIS